MSCQGQEAGKRHIWGRTRSCKSSGPFCGHSRHKIPEHNVCFSQTEVPPILWHPRKSHSPFSCQGQTHVCTVGDHRAGMHNVTACGKGLSILSDQCCDEVNEEGSQWGTNNCGTKAHCGKFPQRPLVYFTSTEKPSGTVSFRISMEILSFRIQWSAWVTLSLWQVSLLWTAV